MYTKKLTGWNQNNFYKLKINLYQNINIRLVI